MQGQIDMDMNTRMASSCDCDVAAGHVPTGTGLLVDSELERLECRVDARLRHLAIADRLRAIGAWAAVLAGATVLVVVLV